MNVLAALRKGIVSVSASPKFPYSVAIAALIAALAFYVIAVLRVDLNGDTRLFDLQPKPDAVENFSGALSLYQKGDYTIRLCGEEYPPRYPFGFSLAMLPAIHFLGIENAVSAPFRTNQALGFAMIIGFFCYFISQRRPIAAATAVMVLVTIPSFIIFSRYSLNGLLGTSLICLAFGLCAEGLRRQTLPFLYAGSFVMGLSVCVRLQMVFYFPLVFSVLLLPQNGRWKQRFVIMVVSGLLFLLGSSPILIYNWGTFGSPLKTGYNFWITDYSSASFLFGPQNIAASIVLLWKEMTLTRTCVGGLDHFGPGNYFTPAFFILAFVALAIYPTDRRRAILMLAASSFTVAMMAWNIPLTRLLVSPAILAVSPICALVERSLQNGAKEKPMIMRILLLVVFVATLLGWPSQARQEKKLTTFESLELLNMDYLNFPPIRYDVVSAFRNRFDDGNALVVSPIDPVYVNNMLLSTSICVPQNWDHGYGFGEKFEFTKEDTDAAMLAARVKEQKIFYLVSRRIDTENIPSIVLTPDSCEWRELPVPATRGSIYEMVERPLEGTDAP